MHTERGAYTRRCTQKVVTATAGVMLFKGPKRGTSLFEEAHDWGGGIGMSRQFGRPIRPKSSPAVSARRVSRPDRRPAVSAEILAGGLDRPNRRRVFRPRTAAEPHRRFIPMSYPPPPP